MWHPWRAQVATLWIKRGIIRLGFFIKSARAKHFRDAAEDLVIDAGKQAVANLNNPAELRAMLLGYTEQVLALENKVGEQAPKVAALDLIATRSEGTLCITDAAKSLCIGPKSPFQWLQEFDCDWSELRKLPSCTLFPIDYCQAYRKMQNGR
jgi:Phage antirepressor protein KilAC domain